MRRSFSASEASGRPSVRSSIFGRRGIVVAYAASRNAAARFMNPTNSGQRSASRGESRRMASIVPASFALETSRSEPPSGSAET
jgi:hypothetical protein